MLNGRLRATLATGAEKDGSAARVTTIHIPHPRPFLGAQSDRCDDQASEAEIATRYMSKRLIEGPKLQR
jgi:hypothetical protein